jgi:hypothetical protein
MAEGTPLGITAAVIAILTLATSIMITLNQQLDRAIRLDNEIAETAHLVLRASLETLELERACSNEGSNEGLKMMLLFMASLDIKNTEMLRTIMSASPAQRFLKWEKIRGLVNKHLSAEEGIRAVFQLTILM